MTLIMGLSNSGKTTYSLKFNNVVHLDDLYNLSLAEKQEIYSSTEEDVCIEGIYLRRKDREFILDAIKAEKRICIFLNTPLEECLSRETRKRPSFMFFT